jgi:hypothetical protein
MYSYSPFGGLLFIHIFFTTELKITYSAFIKKASFNMGLPPQTLTYFLSCHKK